MGKTIITASDVQQARGSGELHIPADAIVTPLAWDMARDLGIKVSCNAGSESSGSSSTALASAETDMVTKVRSIVTSLLGAEAGVLNAASASSDKKWPVRLAKMQDYKGEKFTHPGPPPDMEVTTVDAVDDSHGSPMAAGYMTLTKGSFPWSFDYDEVQIVLEGELHLGGDAGNKVGYPGDIFYVPKGSNITFGTPSWTKFVYVTFPANWEG